MSLFSFLRKNKQESLDDAPFVSRAEGESNTKRNRGKRKQGSAADGKLDPALPEKKRARRRLIGAIALVLAAIIGLPMILDSEPKPLADDVTIRIPSKDKPARQTTPVAATSNVSALNSLDPKEEVIEPPAENAAQPAAQPQAAIQPPAKAAMPAPAPVDKPRDNAKASQPAQTLASEKSAQHTSPSPAPALKAEPKPAAPKAERPDHSARAIAILEGKTDPKAAEKKAGKFVIQIAALASKEKVNELQSKLKEVGINSYTQKVATDSGERIRIRVGPFSSKDEADKVKARIGKLGLNGTLIPA